MCLIHYLGIIAVAAVVIATGAEQLPSSIDAKGTSESQTTSTSTEGKGKIEEGVEKEAIIPLVSTSELNAKGDEAKSVKSAEVGATSPTKASPLGGSQAGKATKKANKKKPSAASELSAVYNSDEYLKEEEEKEKGGGKEQEHKGGFADFLNVVGDLIEITSSTVGDVIDDIVHADGRKVTETVSIVAHDIIEGLKEATAEITHKQ